MQCETDANARLFGVESAELSSLMQIIMPLLLRAVDSDDDVRAVTAALGGMTKIIELLGLQPCRAFMTEVIEAARKLLSGEAVCQITVDSDLEDLEEEQEDEVQSFAYFTRALIGC